MDGDGGGVEVMDGDGGGVEEGGGGGGGGTSTTVPFFPGSGGAGPCPQTTQEKHSTSKTSRVQLLIFLIYKHLYDQSQQRKGLPPRFTRNRFQALERVPLFSNVTTDMKIEQMN